MTVTKFCRWDAALETEAQAYKAAADARSVELYGGIFAAVWYPRQDIDNKWIVPLFAPPYQVDGEDVVETTALADLRENAEIVDTITWPPVEE